MAEKNGEGGGGKPRSSKSSTSSRKLSPWKWERNGGTEKKGFDTFPKIKKVLYQNQVHNYLMGLYELEKALASVPFRSGSSSRRKYNAYTSWARINRNDLIGII